MNKNKIIYGIISALFGYIVFILLIDLIGKPTNIGISFKPIESIEAFLFVFVWGMGNLGWLVGSILLIGYLALFYFIGVWIYNKTRKNLK